MTDEKVVKVELKDNFYRDSFGKVIFIIMGLAISIIALIATSIYLYLSAPPPLIFPVQNEMRVLAPVPLDQPYLSSPEVLQWVADVLPKSFDFDFNHYNDQIKAMEVHFTNDGWKQFVNQLNMYANYNNVQAYKLFIRGTPASAPAIVQKGLIEETGQYGWKVEMQVNITYAGYQPLPNKLVTFQMLIVRVPTLNNLKGVGIDKIIQAPATKASG